MDKNKTPIYVVYKRHTSKQGTHTELKVKGWKKIFHANREQKKAGVEKRQRRTLHNDQRINLRRYNNYKYICIQHRSTAICKANANKYKTGN